MLFFLNRAAGLNDQTRTLIINKIENLGEPIVKVARDLQVNEKTVAIEQREGLKS